MTTSIHIDSTFLHEGVRYVAGEIRVVSPELAGYACGLGWASPAEAPMSTPKAEGATATDLDVHDHISSADVILNAAG